MTWAPASRKREQIILFSKRIDEVLPPDHPARLLDGILGWIDWSRRATKNHGRVGQPPIHSRVLARDLLYRCWCGSGPAGVWRSRRQSDSPTG